MAGRLNKTGSLRKCLLAALLFIPLHAYPACGDNGTWLQVLGSGGPELDDGRTSSSYLLWQNGKARILVDIGSGSMQRFEESGASINDLDAILLSHLHVDHSSDLPALVKAAFFSGRNRDLPVLGPGGNDFMPSTTDFVWRLLGPDGAYPYLASYLDGSDDYRLIPGNITPNGKGEKVIEHVPGFRLVAAAVHHGPLPALAWRIELEGKRVVFSGDMSNQHETLGSLAEQADLLVAHHAVPEQAARVAKNLHMPPSTIGRIAAGARVKKLLLSHHMNRSLARKESSLEIIRKRYQGELVFAQDSQCVEF